MSLMQYLYSRLLDQMLEKLSDMKMVKLPWLVDNYSFIKFMVSPSGQKRPTVKPAPWFNPGSSFQELMLSWVFPTPVARVMPGGYRENASPMTLPVPFMIAGMAYGASVSLPVKIVMARASQ